MPWPPPLFARSIDFLDALGSSHDRCEGTSPANPALADADFAEAYHWMCLQMANLLPTANEGILWL